MPPSASLLVPSLCEFTDTVIVYKSKNRKLCVVFGLSNTSCVYFEVLYCENLKEFAEKIVPTILKYLHQDFDIGTEMLDYWHNYYTYLKQHARKLQIGN